MAHADPSMSPDPPAVSVDLIPHQGHMVLRTPRGSPQHDWIIADSASTCQPFQEFDRSKEGDVALAGKMDGRALLPHRGVTHFLARLSASLRGPEILGSQGPKGGVCGSAFSGLDDGLWTDPAGEGSQAQPQQASPVDAAERGEKRSYCRRWRCIIARRRLLLSRGFGAARPPAVGRVCVRARQHGHCRS